MTYARWKILAGFFALSMCGLASMASASRPKGQMLGCNYTPPVSLDDRHTAAVVPVQPVAQVMKLEDKKAGPPIVTLPTIDVATLPTPTSVPATLVSNMKPDSVPSIVSVPTEPTIPTATPTPIPSPQPMSVPGLAVAVSPPPIPTPETTLPPLKIVADPAVGIVIPAKTVDLPLPTMAVVKESKPDDQPVRMAPLIQSAEKKPVDTTTPNTPTNNVTLTMNLNNGSPAVVLTTSTGSQFSFTCEQIEISAKHPKEDTPTTIKANGKVKFNSPGCQGTCEELVLNVKSLDGTFRNGVKIQCTQNGSSTELTAEQISFHLKSAGNTTIQATGAIGIPVLSPK